MKKYVTLFVALCLLLPCLSGCHMSKRKISEYEAFDYNVIWEKADKVIRPKKFMGTHEYYSIEGVSKKEFIATVKETTFFEVNQTIIFHRIDTSDQLFLL